MPRAERPVASLGRKLLAAATIALALHLGAAVGVAAASAGPTPGGPLAWEEEGWEEGEFEEGAEEESEEVSPGGPGNPPAEAECNLYATTARLVASDRNDSVRLTVRYETNEATDVRVEYWLKGTRGSFQLKPLARHMSTHGTLQGIERLGGPEMEKVHAARVFVIHLDMPGLPQYCEPYFTRRLTARRDSGSRTIWSEPPLGTQPPQVEAARPE